MEGDVGSGKTVAISNIIAAISHEYKCVHVDGNTTSESGINALAKEYDLIFVDDKAFYGRHKKGGDNMNYSKS